MSRRDPLKTALQISLIAGVLTGGWYLAAKAAHARQLPAQKIVDHVDLQKLMGTWYEISRFPNIFQRDDLVGATDNYYPNPDGSIKVLYKYHEARFDAPEKVLEAKMWRETQDNPTGKLKFQALWPFVADYWLIDLGPNYEYLVVGYPSRDMLWIMSRTPTLDEDTYAAILERAKAQHYDVSRLIRVPQQAPAPQAQVMSTP
ncbi:MAG: lipocalin family protein [Candidatus Sericytochromatia bacterium]